MRSDHAVSSLQGVRRKELGDEKARFTAFLFFLTAALLILNNVSFSASLPSVGREEEGLIKPHHVAAALAFFVLMLRGRLYLPPHAVAAYFFTAVSTTFIAFLFFPFNKQVATLVYCFGLAVIGSSIVKSMGVARVLTLVRGAFLFSFLMIMMKDIFYANEIMRAVSSGARVWVPGLVAGGVNPEGSVIALGVPLFFGRRLFYPYLLAAIVLNSVYSSRGGLLTCGGIYFALLLYRTSIKGFVQYIGGSIAAILGLVFFTPGSLKDDVVSKVLWRFANVGSDPGSLGRIELWEAFPDAFSNNVFGYGVMNAVPIIERFAGRDFPEVHMHNIYMQGLLDLGIQTFVFYLIIIGYVVRALFRDREANPLNLVLVFYFLSGAFRFKYYDTLMFLLLGASLTVSVHLWSARHGTSLGRKWFDDAGVSRHLGSRYS